MLQVEPVDGTSTAAIVLGGGRSTRFGSDKTRADFAGTSLLGRVLDVTTQLVDRQVLDDVVVVGDWAPAGTRLGIEAVRDLGPLAGLVHGWTMVDAEVVLLLGGDHPLLVPDLLALLIEHAVRSTEADAVVPVGPDGVEPLVACYRRRTAAVASSRLDAGRRSLIGLLDDLRVEHLDASTWSGVDPEGWSFLDADTPSDLHALRRSAPELDQLD